MIPYTQSTPFTTAAASLLTILHNKKQIPLTKENEFKIWHSSVNLPTRGSSIYGLALVAKRHGLNPKVVVEKKEYEFPDYRFYRYTKEDVEHAAFSELTHLTKAEEQSIPIQEKSFTLKHVQKELEKGNTLLLRLNTKPIRNEKRNTSNFIIVHGYANNYFHIIDPTSAPKSVPKAVMQEAFDSLGTKKYRDHRMIIFKNN